MNLLTSLLPGLRDVRTPFTVGAMWTGLVAVVMFAYPAAVANTAIAHLAGRLKDAVPAVYASGAAAVLVYLVGCVAMPIQSYLGHRISQRARLVARPILKRISYDNRWHRNIGNRLLWRLAGTFSEDTWQAQSLLTTAVGSALAKSGAPEEVRFGFPSGELVERLDIASLQLSASAPDLAQEHDRLKAEAEFRSGVVPPLSALVVFFSWYSFSPWYVSLGVGMVALLPGLVLSGQSHRLRRRRVALAARCVNLGYARIPILDDLTKELENHPLPSSSSVGSWAGAVAGALKRLGEGGLANQMIYGFFTAHGPQQTQVSDMRATIAEREPSLLPTFDQAALTHAQ